MENILIKKNCNHFLTQFSWEIHLLTFPARCANNRSSSFYSSRNMHFTLLFFVSLIRNVWKNLTVSFTPFGYLSCMHRWLQPHLPGNPALSIAWLRLKRAFFCSLSIVLDPELNCYVPYMPWCCLQTDVRDPQIAEDIMSSMPLRSS